MLAFSHASYAPPSKFAGLVKVETYCPRPEKLTPRLLAVSTRQLSRSLVGPTSPVLHGTNAFILHVAPLAFSSFSQILWISRSSSSYSICQPPSFMLRSAYSPPPPLGELTPISPGRSAR